MRTTEHFPSKRRKFNHEDSDLSSQSQPLPQNPVQTPLASFTYSYHDPPIPTSVSFGSNDYSIESPPMLQSQPLTPLTIPHHSRHPSASPHESSPESSLLFVPKRERQLSAGGSTDDSPLFSHPTTPTFPQNSADELTLLSLEPPTYPSPDCGASQLPSFQSENLQDEDIFMTDGNDIDDAQARLQAEAAADGTSSEALWGARYDMCYGSLPANLIAGRKLANHESSIDQELAIEPFGESQFVISTSSGGSVGLLPGRISRGIIAIVQRYYLHLDVYLDPDQGSSESTGLKVAVMLNLYGMSQNATVVGEILNEMELFLQHPTKRDTTVEYQNPHVLQIPEDVSGIGKTTSSKEEVNFETRNFNTIQDTMNDLFQTYDHAKLPECEQTYISPWLKTSLTRHQSEALNWMRSQESSTTSEGFSGGILADDMGMGKSFTTLALVSSDYLRTNEQGHIDIDAEIPRVTLIVTPLSTLSGWKDQINTHLHKNNLRYLIFYNNTNKISQKSLDSFHLIITTYEKVVSECRRRSNSKIFGKKWFRIVLDEAHLIRDPKRKRSEAICSLQGRHRWCLTGTPIQNGISDLSGYFQFLRYLGMESRKAFQERILNPVKSSKENALLDLKSLLGQITLRRTKDMISLPPRKNLLVEVDISSTERVYYDLCKHDTALMFDKALKDRNPKARFSVLQSILRQRQICAHGLDLLPEDVRTRIRKRADRGSQSKTTEFGGLTILCENCDCSLLPKEISEQQCFHILCGDCLLPVPEAAAKSNACPLCTADVEDQAMCNKKSNASLARWQDSVKNLSIVPSPKVEALIKNIQESQKEKPVKCVVFSSWVKMLILIEQAFINHRIQFLRLDGSRNGHEREQIIEEFQKSEEVNVLLMTTGSGGVGLNLTAASWVHMIEPQWNPMMERQAMDRVHRLGQLNPVTTVRYIVRNSIEESILELQKKKLSLAEFCLSNKRNAAGEIEALREVFK